ncbi:MAG: hypothetical protein H0T45_18680 [Pyrinomonadaceae bacterium]|jgi:hypothetical protein|nr:hypothetical protein [Pyrinomonadaceae bacterium]MDQ3134829.1 hypothetical protein [Acidobacteriota bacterium]
MAGRRKMWVYCPPKPPQPTVPETLKAEVSEKANQLLESTLKRQYIKPPPKDYQFNYLVDLYTKWYRSYFYFCSKYACPGPSAISPFFEARFARMQYVGDRRFNLAFMRHTGEWLEIFTVLSVEECLDAVKDGGYFQP